MNRNKILSSIAVLPWLLAAAGAGAECFVYVDRDQLREVTIDGETWLAGPEAPIVQQTCRPDDVLDAQAETLRQLAELVERYPEVTAELVADLAEYRALTDEYREQTETVLALTRDYDGLTERYDTLTGDYQALTTRYDELATDYRDLALDTESGISFDAGIGVNDDGDVATLLGIGYRRMRFWGTVDEDQSALFIGRSFRF